MTINDMHPSDIAEHRRKQLIATRNKIASDAKNDTDELTFQGSDSEKEIRSAAQKTRARMDLIEMSRLMSADDTSELKEMMRDL